MSDASYSPEESVDVEQSSPAVTLDLFSRPSYLDVIYRVLVCSRCGKCYVRKNYERHIRDVYRLTGKAKQLMLQWLATEDIAEKESDVQPPPANEPPIDGLPVYDGYACNSIDCQYLTTSEELIRKHIPKQYGRKYSKGNGATSIVKLQNLFAKSLQYFQVENPNPPTSTATFNTLVINKVYAEACCNNDLYFVS